MNTLILRRRQLLPWWMRVFIWIFMLLGLSSIITRALELIGVSLGVNSPKTIYGLETYEKISVLSFLITSLLIFKGVVAFGMWTEKKWAIKFGISDAIIGILICVSVMFIEPLFRIDKDGVYDLNFRFELLLLIPYLLSCVKIRKEWVNFTDAPLVVKTSTENIASESFVEEKNDEVKMDEHETGNENKKDIVLDKEDPRRFMPN